jgi:hypothetical protein
VDIAWLSFPKVNLRIVNCCSLRLPPVTAQFRFLFALLHLQPLEFAALEFPNFEFGLGGDVLEGQAGTARRLLIRMAVSAYTVFAVAF